VKKDITKATSGGSNIEVFTPDTGKKISRKSNDHSGKKYKQFAMSNEQSRSFFIQY